MKVDYLIVGGGLAGVNFALHCLENHKSFIILDDASPGASFAAAGIVNPVTGRNYVLSWNILELLDVLRSAYKRWEDRLGCKVLYPLEIRRVLNTVTEENKWYARYNDPRYGPFLDEDWRGTTDQCFHKGGLPVVRLKLGFRLDNVGLITSVRDMLMPRGMWKVEHFEWAKWQPEEPRYKDIHYEAIVFSRGAYEAGRPFDFLPLRPNLGEVLIISLPEHVITYAIKKKLFIVPLGENRYWVGGTYRNVNDAHGARPTFGTLLESLEETLDIPYRIEQRRFGVRATTPDRRPIIGGHPTFSKVFILNGLGTKGASLSPYCAQHLFDHIAYGTDIPNEISIGRFSTIRD